MRQNDFEVLFFQAEFRKGNFKAHEHFLINAQESHDSFSCGRPEDPLESMTWKPQCVKSSPTDNVDELRAEVEERYVDFMSNTMKLDRISFRDDHNCLKVNTSIVLHEGAHNCGTSLITPSTPLEGNVIATNDTDNSSVASESEMNGHLKPNEFLRQNLHTLPWLRH